MASFLKEFAHLAIQLDKIKSATNNFDNKNFIGVGGFGKVFKGELSLGEEKILVAFKRLDRKYGQGDSEFFKEIRMLSCYKHQNLISLLGFCKEGHEMILVYEFASHGSLDQILNDAALTWKQRLKICLGAAKGLSFLHDPKEEQQRVLHRDIKSANILLDDNLNAKVADFGLSKISPANQKYTFLFTSPVGTHGYCDPLYMTDYQLTKESDVYSFGVVLFEVLCGRVCFEYRDRKLHVFVPFWKECYEQKNLDEIIFPDIKHQLDPSSVETFVDIAYQCLHKTREQRPTMSFVVEKLTAALESKELHDLKLQGYEFGEIIRAADPPLIFKSIKELKALLSKGFPVNGGKTLVSVNDKGQVCERIYIEACLDQIQYYYVLSYPSGFENSRFPGGRCYYKHENELEVRVKAQFLCPLITYSVNLVFRNDALKLCKTLHYNVNGEAKCCMVYDTYEKEDGWIVVPLHQFKSDKKTADFTINFEKYQNTLLVAGFEFQPLEEKVELHYLGLEEYQDIVEAASQLLFYKSPEELKKFLSIGFHLNNHKTWFSLNENGEHCEMLSIANCLISREGGYNFSYTQLYSRFPRFFKTNKKGFKVHIRTQFLTPSIRYTVNLVLCKGDFHGQQKYAPLRYKLEGETKTSIVYIANATKDKYSFIAELYQFTSNERTLDLEIVFEDHKYDLEVEGILFQPLEKVEHEQVLGDEKQSNDSSQWKMMKGLFSNLLKRFNGQERYIQYAIDNNGKKSLIFSARGMIRISDESFRFSSESRFGEVAVISYNCFSIEMKIKRDALTPETAYACYLVYKSTAAQPILNIGYPISYIYLVIPPETPIIGEKLDQNTHYALTRPKLDYVPRQRSDGWMEVKLREYQTQSSAETIDIDVRLWTPDCENMSELIIESIELRPIVAHST